MEIVIIVATVIGIVLVEAIAFLTYKIFKIEKELEKNVENVNGLSECVLTMAKKMPGIDVVEEHTNSSDFDFPGV